MVFFASQLGAAATLAGLLFVSVSVNQARILSLSRMAARGAEALSMLFLALVAASLPLVPGQRSRLLGGEVLLAGAVVLAAALRFQSTYLDRLSLPHHRRTLVPVMSN